MLWQDTSLLRSTTFARCTELCNPRFGQVCSADLLEPLEEFSNQIRNLESFPWMWTTNSRLKSTAHKLQWCLSEKSYVARLQTYLGVHASDINMLLSTYELEATELASDEIKLNIVCAWERFNETRSLIRSVRWDVAAQDATVRANSTMISRLFCMIRNEVAGSWEQLVKMVSKVWYAHCSCLLSVTKYTSVST